MKCTICGKPIVLTPSAEERARKFGGKPSDYANMFKQHADCIVQKRREETEALVRRINGGTP